MPSDSDWTNVPSSRPKPKKWDNKQGIDNDRAKKLQSGFQSPITSLSDAWGAITGKKKKSTNTDPTDSE